MAIVLSKSQRIELENIVTYQCGEARLYRRARLVLLAANGSSISVIARKTETSRCRVRAWLQRFQQFGADGLGDLSRSGRPCLITPLDQHQVIAAACRAPSKFGLQRTLWSHAALADALMAAGRVRNISPRTVGRILEQAEIKPHRVKMWCHSDDPAFQEKMRDIVSLYVHPPKGEPVLSIDEKTGMQALSRYRAITTPAQGRRARLDFEYKRNGTRCLFGCFNVGTGKVFVRCTAQRKRTDFFSFMDEVAALYRQSRVHVILDNLNTHTDTRKGAFFSDWNRRHGNRFVVHYTPTHGSWLNQIE